MTMKSRQHFTEQAQTELAINLLTKKIPKGKRSKCHCISHKKIKTLRRAANATKQLREKRGEKARVVFLWAAVVQEVKKSFSYQKVASSIPCRSVLDQGTEPLIAPDVLDTARSEERRVETE